jgi:hypothetical protein
MLAMALLLLLLQLGVAIVCAAPTAPTAPAAPCDTKDFSGHHCHLSLSNLTDSKITTAEQCTAAVCAAGGGLDTSQWCAADAGCSPVGCYGATVSKQASCPRTHGWVTSLVNYSPAPAPPPGMDSRTVPQPTADKHGAKCLNGDAPTVEMRLNKSSTQWVLFLEGGGWCYGASANATIASCAGRGGFVPGIDAVVGESSASEAAARRQTPDYGGVMGSSPETNPDFHTWNAVFIHYCDGASMGSSRTDPIAVKDKKGKPAQLWMRGRNNFNAVIDDLLTTQGLDKATEVILSGGSAGGLAVFYNLDHLVTLLPASVRVTGFPDAGCESRPLRNSLTLTLTHSLSSRTPHTLSRGSTSPLLLAAGLVPCPPCQYMSLYVACSLHGCTELRRRLQGRRSSLERDRVWRDQREVPRCIPCNGGVEVPACPLHPTSHPGGYLCDELSV